MYARARLLTGGCARAHVHGVWFRGGDSIGRQVQNDAVGFDEMILAEGVHKAHLCAGEAVAAHGGVDVLSWEVTRAYCTVRSLGSRVNW